MKLAIGVLVLATGGTAASAQVSISWSSIDCGGGRSASATLILRGTIGQFDAGGALGSPSLRLVGGFWGGGATARCPADLDDGSGSGTPDGAVTLDDLLFFVSAYEIGGTAADVDDGTSTGTPDNAVTVDDLLYFIARYEAGC